MTDYLHHTFDPDEAEFVSVIDELPLWSAPFGLDLLETVRLRPGLVALDVGCGGGFPLIELAQRLGPTGKAFGVDPSKAVVERARLKIRVYHLTNVSVVEAEAEKLPFDDGSFDLIVSNNGISNVRDIDQALVECHRTAKPGAQLVMTYNLEDTMREFYELFEAVLIKNGLELAGLRDHIHKKRKPLAEMKRCLERAGFRIRGVAEKSFAIHVVDAAAWFNHHLIKYWFLPPWKELVPPDAREGVFTQLEQRIDAVARERGAFTVTVPYAVIDAEKAA